MHQAEIFLRYVDFVGQGDTTRLDAANHFGVSKSTATYHLDRAVMEGYLERFYAFTNANQTGWAYRKVNSNKSLFEDPETEDLIPQQGDTVYTYCRYCEEPMFYTEGQGTDVCCECDNRTIAELTPYL